MATPPVPITGSPWQSAWSTTTSPKLAPAAGSFAVGVGDLIVVALTAENDKVIGGTPTNAATGPAAITWTQDQDVNPDSRGGLWAGATAWTGVVTAAGNVQVSVANTGTTTLDYGIIVWAFSSHGGVGQTLKGNASGTAPSATPGAPWTANSTVCAANADWNAVVLATRTYLTSGAVGLGTSQKWSMVAVEVLGTAGAPPPPLDSMGVNTSVLGTQFQGRQKRAVMGSSLGGLRRAGGVLSGVQRVGVRRALLPEGLIVPPTPPVTGASNTTNTADSAPAVESLSVVVTHVRGTSDVAAAIDSVVRAYAGARSMGDLAPAVELTGRVFAGARGLAESAPAVESVSRAGVFARGVSDSAPAVDSAARAAAQARAVGDSAPAVDSVVRAAAFPRATGDAAPASEVVARAVAFPRATADSAPAGEAIARTSAQARGVGDSAPAADVAARAVARNGRQRPGD
jgi:hypothetical protein